MLKYTLYDSFLLYKTCRRFNVVSVIPLNMTKCSYNQGCGSGSGSESGGSASLLVEAEAEAEAPLQN